MPKGNPPWNFAEINQRKKVTGPWYVDVKQGGKYRFTLRQQPEVANKPLIAERAKISVAGLEREAPVAAGSKGAVFELEIPAGRTTLTTWLYDESGEAGGAYFTDVEKLD